MTPEPRSLAQAAIGAATVFCWYALPDVVRTRRRRAVAKLALAGAAVPLLISLSRDEEGTAQEGPAADPTDPDAGPGAAETPGAGPAGDGSTGTTAPSPQDAGQSWRTWAMVGAGGLLLVGSAVANVVVERRILARGERRRAEGVRAAHTRQALAAGLAAGVVSLLDED